jgi:hypothetical protein
VLSDARAPVQEFHISFISFIVVPILWKLWIQLTPARPMPACSGESTKLHKI